MAGPYYFDRTKDTSTTTGTGTLTLANSAPTGFRTFGSVLANGDTCYYAIVLQSGSEWETGVGTYTSSGTTLARTRVIASSNSGSAVNFSSGTKDVFITIPGNQLCWLPDMVPPVDANYTWANQGTATITQNKSGLYLRAPAAASDNLRVRYKAAPATPYYVEYGFLSNWSYVNLNMLGVGFRQSSDGKLHTWGLMINTGSDGSRVQENNKWSSPTAFASQYASKVGLPPPSPLTFIRLGDDGTNRTIDLSVDGQNWINVHSVGRTDYLTADQVCFWCNSASASGDGVGLLLLHDKNTA